MIQAGGRVQAPFSMRVVVRGAGAAKAQEEEAIPAAGMALAIPGVSRLAAESRAGRAAILRLTSLSSNFADVLAGNSRAAAMGRR